MSEEQRIQIMLSRTGDFLGILRTTLFVLLGIGIATHFGDGYSAPLMVLTVAITAFGILAGGAAMDDMIALREDMSDEVANSNYGKAVKGRNLPALKTLSAALIGLSGLAAILVMLI